MRFLLALLSACALFSCCSRGAHVGVERVDLSLFQTFDRVQQGVVNPNHMLTAEETRNKSFYLIHFDVPSLCSMCLLKQYYLWDELIAQLGEEEVEYLFLLEPRKEYTCESLAEALNEGYFSRPVFLDWTGVFTVRNRLSTHMGSADILTDQNGVVLFVGDLRNDVRDYSRILRKIRRTSFNHPAIISNRY